MLSETSSETHVSDPPFLAPATVFLLQAPSKEIQAKETTGKSLFSFSVHYRIAVMV